MRIAVMMMGLLAGLLQAKTDSSKEQKYSDNLRKLQRQYMKEMDRFSKMCDERGGQVVGNKGALGDMGCVAKPVPPPPAPAPQSPAPNPPK